MKQMPKKKPLILKIKVNTLLKYFTQLIFSFQI